MTSSLDILRDIGARKGPAKILVAFGYTGWGPNQLEREIEKRTWGLRRPIQRWSSMRTGTKSGITPGSIAPRNSERRIYRQAARRCSLLLKV